MLRRDLEIFCLGTAIVVVFRSEGRPRIGAKRLAAYGRAIR